MKVKYKQTGQIYDMADDAQVDTTLFEVVGGGQTSMQQTTQEEVSQPKSITGYSLEQILQGLQRARSAGNKTAEADLNDLYNKEFQYQTSNIETQDPTLKGKEEAQVEIAKQKALEAAGLGKKEEDATTKERKTLREELLALAGDAKTFIKTNKGKELTGFSYGGMPRKLREIFGWVSPEQIKTSSLLSQINAIVAFSQSEGGGKQFTKTEKDLLRGMILDPGEDEKVLYGKLSGIIEGIGRKKEVREGKTNIQSPIKQRPSLKDILE